MDRFLYPIFKLLIIFVLTAPASATIIEVPQDLPTIQAAIDSAATGDTVLVAPGFYQEALTITAKDITLASHYIISNDSSAISNTILDGDNKAFTVIELSNLPAGETVISGFTIQNGRDGISALSPFHLRYNNIKNCLDGVDYETGSGGTCMYNRLFDNVDDGIDLDGRVEITIAHNDIFDNDDDGIEIRLHPFGGSRIYDYIIEWNNISNNGEDGIQLIDYGSMAPRRFFISRNRIANNVMVGIGCMGDENTIENYEGYPIPVPIFVTNNVISNNNHGITGGDSLIATNNIIEGHSVLGLKNVRGNSEVAYNLFWQNGLDADSSNEGNGNIRNADPLLNSDFTLQQGSPCIDAGQPDCLDPDSTTCDIGVYYFEQNTTSLNDMTHSPDDFFLDHNYPNPFNPATVIGYSLSVNSSTTLVVYDILGREIRSLVNEQQPAGSYKISWDGRDTDGIAVGSGIYFYQLRTGDFVQTRRMLLVR